MIQLEPDSRTIAWTADAMDFFSVNDQPSYRLHVRADDLYVGILVCHFSVEAVWEQDDRYRECDLVSFMHLSSDLPIDDLYHAYPPFQVGPSHFQLSAFTVAHHRRRSLGAVRLSLSQLLILSHLN